MQLNNSQLTFPYSLIFCDLFCLFLMKMILLPRLEMCHVFPAHKLITIYFKLCLNHCHQGVVLCQHTWQKNEH